MPDSSRYVHPDYELAERYEDEELAEQAREAAELEAHRHDHDECYHADAGCHREPCGDCPRGECGEVVTELAWYLAIAGCVALIAFQMLRGLWS